MVFTSPDKLLSYVESPDVESGEYLAAFDADGKCFALDVPEPTVRKTGWIVNSMELTPVVLRLVNATAADSLHEILAQKLVDSDPAASLGELVRRASTELKLR